MYCTLIMTFLIVMTHLSLFPLSVSFFHLSTPSLTVLSILSSLSAMIRDCSSEVASSNDWSRSWLSLRNLRDVNFIWCLNEWVRDDDDMYHLTCLLWWPIWSFPAPAWPASVPGRRILIGEPRRRTRTLSNAHWLLHELLAEVGD